MSDLEMRSTTGACIACGELTDNTEHVCTDCTAGARARLRVRQLTDDELLAEHRGGDRSKTSCDVLSNVALAAELGVSEATVRRARLVELADRGLIALDEIPATKPHLSRGEGNESWYTPEAILDIARAAMGGIDLDPASSDAAQAVVQARAFFKKDDDGLSREWAGTVWLNPPYTGGLVDQFADKLIAEYEAGRVSEAVWLSNNATETAWFQRLAAVATVVFFPAGRVRFWGETDGQRTVGAPLQGQALLYFGASADIFASECANLGYVSQPYNG